MFKTYCFSLGKYGKEAEELVRHWLACIGYRVASDPSKYGPDVWYEPLDKSDEPFTVEVERCQSARWTGTKFRYSTISVIERRWKYFRTGLNMVVNSDMTRAYIVYPSSARKAYSEGRIETSSNVYMECEKRLMVPVADCRLFDLTNTTKRSIDRYKAGELFSVH